MDFILLNCAFMTVKVNTVNWLKYLSTIMLHNSIIATYQGTDSKKR